MPSRSNRWRFVLSVCAAVAVASGAAPASQKPGKLVIAGGAITTSKREVWGVMMSERLAGRPIGIISTASAKPAESGQPLARSLVEEYGPNAAVFIPLDSKLDNAANAEIVALIRRCGGFFFTGGNQTLTPRTLLNRDGSATPALTAIWEVHRAGGVIGGSSAGAAIMSDPMITGGTSSGALANGVTPATTPKASQGVTIGRGLGFSPGVLYCQHHLERGRFGRLLVALVSNTVGLSTGFGISEDTALVVDHAADCARLIGARDAVHLQTAGAKRAADGRINGVRLNYLSPGDRVRLSSGIVEPGPGKIAVPPHPDKKDIEIPNAWAQEALRHLLIELAQARATAHAVAKEARFELIFQRTPDSRVWASSTEPRHWTMSGIQVEVRPLGE